MSLVWTDDDRTDLQHAIELIRALVDRHPTEVTAPMLVTAQLAVHDIEVLQRHLGMNHEV